MHCIDKTTWRAAKRALERAIALHLDDPNVSLTDLGFRTRSSQGHRIVPELAVRVHVHHKLQGKDLQRFAPRHPNRVINARRIGFAVDVPQATYAFDWLQPAPPADDPMLERAASPGDAGRVALAHSRGCGGRVYDRDSGVPMILSTRHVLKAAGRLNSDLRAAVRREKKGSVLPELHGATDSGVQACLDAALFHEDETRAVKAFSIFDSEAGGVTIPQLGMQVIKRGRDAEASEGIVTGILGSARLRTGGHDVLLRHLVHISPRQAGAVIRSGGDSGAWWVEPATDRVVAFHIAGSDCPQGALAHSMPEVLHAFNAEIAAVSPPRTPRPVKTPESMNANAHAAKGAAFHAIAPRRLRRQSRRIEGVVLSMIVLVIGLLGMAHRGHDQISRGEQVARIDELQLTVRQLRAVCLIDSSRWRAQRKVLAIIDQFNSSMDGPLKYRIADTVYDMSLKYPNLDVELICATITHESGRSWNPRVKSHAGALGLMQVMPATGEELAAAEGIIWASAESALFDPIVNIRLGCRYLSALVEAYSIDGGLAAYNGGAGRAARWLKQARAEGILHEETALYVPSILRIYEQYRRKNI